MKKILTETEIAYAAGIFDGEGCITLPDQRGGKGSSFYLKIHVNNTDIRVVNWLDDRFDGFTASYDRPNPKHKAIHTWASVSREAAEFLRTVLPYLVIKAEQAAVGLEFQGTIKFGWGRYGMPEEMKRYRAELKERLYSYRGAHAKRNPIKHLNPSAEST